MKGQNHMKMRISIVLAICLMMSVFVINGYAKENKENYWAWTKQDWENASMEEKERCGFLILADLMGLGDNMRGAIEAYGTNIDTQAGVMAIEVVFAENPVITIGDIAKIMKEEMGISLHAAEASTEKSSYLAWGKTDWENASEEEKLECCKMMAQKLMDLPDGMIETIDEKTVKEGTTQMKSGIDQLFGSGKYDAYIIEDFLKMMKR